MLDSASITSYLDGTPVGTGSATGLNGDFEGALPRTLAIGQEGNNASYWGGSIDDVRIYNRALSPTDIGDLYAYTGGGGGGAYIPDKTDWSPGGATTTPGNATASTTQPLTLQFRIKKTGTDVPDYASSWWGTDDTTPNALFAGIPASAQTVIDRSTAAGSGTVMTVLYDLDVPASQLTGTYSGSITYTVTANP